ncbi:MAG: hypothetical protein UIB63_05675 [Methanobrevibacter sp.]|uniref:hypothetical protein n=1 Tax=Methanobrevibacter sp. TaxID=66852 RepID=UPI002E7614EE|nr:hypothetical protein [Methanobrevibacter sp.]MEE0942583.1 hypothetical protein [Methanobrevibacter sp.]
MSEKYIRKNKNNFTVVKNSRTYGKYDSLDVAVFARDLLVSSDWQLDNIHDEIFEIDNGYLVFKVIDDKLFCLGQFSEKPTFDAISKLTRKKIRNPNNSKYGLNISRLFDNYIIKKQIAGDEYIFGVFDNLEDATFSRNFLLEHDWDVNAFGEIEFCDETDTYKIVEVFDDRIYILASYETLAEAEKNLKNAKSEFLNKIFKHKNGLANYPHLDILTDRIDELENDFQLKTQDDFWNIGDVENPLEDIIFNLTPWQKIIYDNAGDEFTFQQLKVKLKRYESKNFDKKIQRYLDELQELNLIEKLDDDVYRKV